MTTGNRPRPLADLVPDLTKDVFGKKNLLFGKMVTQWAHIAGPELAGRVAPLELRFQRQSAKGKDDKTPPKAVLHLAVQPSFALEFSYQKGLLIERLNVFFGYPAVSDIKIIQNAAVFERKTAKPVKTRPLTMEQQRHIDELTAGIQENDLQTALKNLGKAIASRKE